MKFSTKAIHAGQEPDASTGAVVVPISQATTYAQDEFGVSKGFDYGRTINPTRLALERNLAALENGKHGFAFSSGMAATSAVMGLLKERNHVIVTSNVYGGTFRYFDTVMKNYGLEFSWVDTSRTENIEQSLKPNSKMIFIETPSNPMLTLTDLSYVAKFAEKNGLVSVVDNTFMSPYFQNPLEFGCDIVVHSTTKYIGGHSDVIGGCVITNSNELAEKIKFIQNAAGAVPSPLDSWLVLRSTKTLALRMEKHNENAMKIAEELDKNHSDKVKKIYYPGLKSHPQHELAKRQMRGFGGIISVDLGSTEKAIAFFNRLKLFYRAESLGAVESLVCHPATMTHASVPKEEREKFGLTDGLIRLSVGIEDCEDLIEDILQAVK
jgi:cystathionine beta-lyase/cystathionine gamma-synthase